MPASILIRARNAYRGPLDDRGDIHLEDVQSRRVVRTVDDVALSRAVRIPDLDQQRTYLARVFPRRYRPVSGLVMVAGGSEYEIKVACPVIPDRVINVEFPTFGQLEATLKRILTASNEVENLEGKTGKPLYDALDSHQRAGLLNVFSKMQRTVFSGGTTVGDFVDSIYRVRGDRFFANVKKSLRDMVKNEIPAGTFREVSGALHTPPPGYSNAGSFKTLDSYGNLQLSFFSRGQDGNIDFKIDADIDDAAGIGHVFQVLRNWLTEGETHPYDIHQILVYHQRLDPGYFLVT